MQSKSDKIIPSLEVQDAGGQTNLLSNTLIDRQDT